MGLSSAKTLSLVLSDTWDHDYNLRLQAKLEARNGQDDILIEQPEALPLNVRVETAEGELVGGLVAQTFWGWMVIKLLVLDDGYRGTGVGQRLIGMAHGEARARGCSHAQTMTYDFQALRFYQKQGYRIVGCLESYPDGFDYFWLRKDFDDGERLTDEGTDPTGIDSGDRPDRLRDDPAAGRK